MLPDHEHRSRRVNLDGAEPVMRELVSPILVGLRRMSDREPEQARRTA